MPGRSSGGSFFVLPQVDDDLLGGCLGVLVELDQVLMIADGDKVSSFVVKDAGVSDDENYPGVGAARVIRAVCTIEGLNRILGTVVIKDPRGKVHVIGDVEPEKMEGVTLGQTLVVVYAEALALSLEPAADDE